MNFPKRVEVAVGVVIRPDGAVLFGERVEGKPYAGWWEFPGGKLEAGESVEQALARELHEELGLNVHDSSPWVVRDFTYPHATVRLHFQRVTDWAGEPQSREGQRFVWQKADAITVGPMLPAALPVIEWLRLPQRLLRVPAGRLLAQEQLSASQGPAIILADAQAGQGRTAMRDWLIALRRQRGARSDGVSSRLLLCSPDFEGVADLVDGRVLNRTELLARPIPVRPPDSHGLAESPVASSVQGVTGMHPDADLRGAPDDAGPKPLCDAVGAWCDSPADIELAAASGCALAISDAMDLGRLESLARQTRLPLFARPVGGATARGLHGLLEES